MRPHGGVFSSAERGHCASQGDDCPERWDGLFAAQCHPTEVSDAVEEAPDQVPRLVSCPIHGLAPARAGFCLICAFAQRSSAMQRRRSSASEAASAMTCPTPCSPSIRQRTGVSTAPSSALRRRRRFEGRGSTLPFSRSTKADRATASVSANALTANRRSAEHARSYGPGFAECLRGASVRALRPNWRSRSRTRLSRTRTAACPVTPLSACLATAPPSAIEKISPPRPRLNQDAVRRNAGSAADVRGLRPPGRRDPGRIAVLNGYAALGVSVTEPVGEVYPGNTTPSAFGRLAHQSLLRASAL